MKRLFPLFFLLPCLVLTLSTTSCSTMGGAVANMIPKPEVAYKGVRLGSLSTKALEVVLDLDVTNKLGLPLSLAGFDYDLQVQGNSLLKNEVNEGISVPAMGTGTVSLPLKIPFGDLYNVYDSLAGAKEFDYSVGGGVKVSVPGMPGMGSIRVPVSHSGTLPVVKPPSIGIAGIRPSGSGFTVDMEVGNPNFFNVDLNEMTYGLKLNGSPAVKQAKLDAINLEPGGKQVVSVPIEADVMGMGMGLLNLITGKGKFSYDFLGDVDLNTGLADFPRLKMPLSSSGNF